MFTWSWSSLVVIPSGTLCCQTSSNSDRLNLTAFCKSICAIALHILSSCISKKTSPAKKQKLGYLGFLPFDKTTALYFHSVLHSRLLYTKHPFFFLGKQFDLVLIWINYGIFSFSGKNYAEYSNTVLTTVLICINKCVCPPCFPLSVYCSSNSSHSYFWMACKQNFHFFNHPYEIMKRWDFIFSHTDLAKVSVPNQV